MRDKLARVHSGPCEAVNRFVDQLRETRPAANIPYVDPDCGGVEATTLMLFQDPGPKAAAPGGSGMLSISNDDASAATLCEVLATLKIDWKSVVPWNAVPWYTGGGNSASDKRDGLATLPQLVTLLPNLKTVITFGGVATKSWQTAVASSPALGRYTHVATLHPSVRGLTRGGRQKMHIGRKQLEADVAKTARS